MNYIKFRILVDFSLIIITTGLRPVNTWIILSMPGSKEDFKSNNAVSLYDLHWSRPSTRTPVPRVMKFTIFCGTFLGLHYYIQWFV